MELPDIARPTFIASSDGRTLLAAHHIVSLHAAPLGGLNAIFANTTDGNSHCLCLNFERLADALSQINTIERAIASIVNQQ